MQKKVQKYQEEKIPAYQEKTQKTIPSGGNDKRKIIFNCLGTFYAAGLIVICLVGPVVGVSQILNFIFRDKKTSADSVNLIFWTGSVYCLKIDFSGTFEEYMIISSFAACILMSLVHLYIPVRALCEPSFTSGKPSIHVRYTRAVTWISSS